MVRLIALVLQIKYRTNMKYLSLLLLLILSKFTNGQQVFTKFEKVVMFDDFSCISNRWEQKNNSTDQLIISDEMYTVKRLKDTYFVVSLPEQGQEYANFEVVSSIKLEIDPTNKNSSGGLIIKAQKTGDGALILEFNAKKEYRIGVMANGNMQLLFGSSNGGWIKTKHLKKNGFNEVRIITSGNEFDLYFNTKFVRTFIETTFETGRIGFFANAKSGVVADYVLIRANEAKESETENPEDKTMTELATIFKNKIDQQHATIDQLNQDLNICRSSLSLDTSVISQNKTLKKENSDLLFRVNSLETELEKAKERLSYLESMKADIESNSNGDLILNLTQMLSRENAKNEVLKKENEKLRKDIKELQQRY